MSGVKHDQEKPDFSLLPLKAMEAVVRVLEFGAKKYSRQNWRQVKPARRYFAACLRHLAEYQAGERLDSQSGVSHLAHAVACLLFLLWHESLGSFGPEQIDE